MALHDIAQTLEDGLQAIPLLDAHTHIDASHLSARGLHDVLLYHMVISDLASAGCPNRARLSDDPDDAEAEARLLEALPYVHGIRNTSCFWGLRIILRELYGWHEPITPDNWRRLDALIRERAADPTWGRAILRRAGVQRSCTELWRGRDGLADDVFHYALEWAFFARAQWGVNDIPLFELERAWNQPHPGAPLPVTMGGRPSLQREIRTLDDVHAAMQHYVERIPYDRVISTAQHISTDLNLRAVTPDEMAAALGRRAQAGEAERDVYASYLLETFLSALEPHADQILFQFSFGAEPLPYETGSKLRQASIYEVAEIIARHPRLRFQAFLSSTHANQALCTLARELPNLTLAGYWWHSFFPSAIRQVLDERLDMLGAGRQIGFFSDAYCVDWTYAKATLVRKQFAAVLAERVAQGQYTLDEALDIAHTLLFEAPQTLLGMSPSPTLGAGGDPEATHSR